MVIRSPIDVLVLDMRMPLLDGLMVYSRLKRENKAVPTIIVSAYARDERAKLLTLEHLEVTGIIAKPFAPEQLLTMIRGVFSPVARKA